VIAPQAKANSSAGIDVGATTLAMETRLLALFAQAGEVDLYCGGLEPSSVVPFRLCVRGRREVQQGSRCDRLAPLADRRCTRNRRCIANRGQKHSNNGDGSSCFRFLSIRSKRLAYARLFATAAV